MKVKDAPLATTLLMARHQRRVLTYFQVKDSRVLKDVKEHRRCCFAVVVLQPLFLQVVEDGLVLDELIVQFVEEDRCFVFFFVLVEAVAS